MKLVSSCRYVLAVGMLLAGIWSCKKNNNSIPTSLKGDWELRQASGNITINYQPGNGNILSFSDSVYKKYTNGVLSKSGNYKIIKDTTFDALIVPAGEYSSRIIYDGDTAATKIFFQFSNNMVTFISGSFAADGGSILKYVVK